MLFSISTTLPENPQPQALVSRVARMTLVSGLSYSVALAFLERVLPIKPTWVAGEVIGGVLLVGLPVMLVARTPQTTPITWRDYERMVMVGFVGAGLPIFVWQVLEYLVMPTFE